MKESVKGGALTEVTLYVLLALYTPNHGYGIMKFAEEKTNGRLVLGAGTLYGAVNSLVKKNWIKLFNETDKKKEYLITDLGKEAVNREIDRLAGALETARQTIC